METNSIDGSRRTGATAIVPVIYRVLRTPFLFALWMCMGLCVEIPGPTLKDLMWRLNTNYAQVARAVSARCIGMIIGALGGGFFVDKVARFSDLILAITLAIMGASILAIPLTTSLALLWFLFALTGFSSIINIAGNKIILQIWKSKAASQIHFMHIGYGVGALVAPLLSNSYLAVPVAPSEAVMANRSGVEYTETTVKPGFFMHASYSLDSTYHETTNNTRSSGNISLTEYELYSETNYTSQFLVESRIEIPYSIVGALILCTSVAFVIFQIIEFLVLSVWKVPVTSPKPKQKTLQKLVDPGTCAEGDTWFGLKMFSLLFLFFFISIGQERMCATFIRSFSIDGFAFSKDEGSYLNTAFWGSFILGRILGFVAAKWLPIRVLLLLEVCGVLVSSLCLTALVNLVHQNNHLMLWIFTQCIGLFMGPIFSSGISWVDRHIAVSGIALTVIISGVGLGSMAQLWLIGYLYDAYGPASFLYLMTASSTAVCLTAGALTAATWNRGNRYKSYAMAVSLIVENTKDSEKVVENGKV